VSNVIHREEVFRKRSFDRMMGQLDSMFGSAGAKWEEFSLLAASDPDQAIKRFPEFIEAMRDIGSPGGRAYETMAGGPNQDWIAPFFSVVGQYYPFLSRETRTIFLLQCRDYLDRLRCDCSQNHVELINAPLLLADILLSDRWLYWPGLDRAKAILRGKSAAELKQMDRSTLETCWIAFALIWNTEVSLLPVREWYYREYAETVDLALDFIAALTAKIAKNEISEGKKYEDSIARSLSKFDPMMHERIRELIKEERWIWILKA